MKKNVKDFSKKYDRKIRFEFMVIDDRSNFILFVIDIRKINRKKKREYIVFYEISVKVIIKVSCKIECDKIIESSMW